MHLIEAYQRDPQSIMIFDRGYASHEMIDFLESIKQPYVSRIPRHGFKPSQAMFDDDRVKDQTVIIQDHQVRLVRIVLSTGEVEVLATNVFHDLSLGSVHLI